LPLYAVLLTLPPIHIEFFTYLDEQLEKIDKFYSEREKEAQARSKALEIQLRELEDHRKIFLVNDLLPPPKALFSFPFDPTGSLSKRRPLLVTNSEIPPPVPTWTATE
jgi:hypothetical protein